MFGLDVMELVIGLGIMVVIGTIGFVALRALARSVGGGSRPDQRALMLEERTARLEEGLATLTEQLERVVTEQEFTDRLLGERAGVRKDVP